MVGSLICTWPQLSSVGDAAGASAALISSAAKYVLSVGCFCVASVLKDRAFRAEELDVFVVNTFGSLSQFIVTLLLLPITFALATSQTPLDYMRSALAALMGWSGAPGAHVMPFLR